MTTKADERFGSRAASGCAEATTEMWSGGCRVLGDFFRTLSDSAYRPARRSGDDRRVGSLVRDEFPNVVEALTTSVSKAVAEAGRTITRTADICTDSLGSNRDDAAEAAKPAAHEPASTHARPKA